MDYYKKEKIKFSLFVLLFVGLILASVFLIRGCFNSVENAIANYAEEKEATYYTVIVNDKTYYHCNNLTKSITGKTLTFECDGVKYQFSDNFAYRREEQNQ